MSDAPGSGNYINANPKTEAQVRAALFAARNLNDGLQAEVDALEAEIDAIQANYVYADSVFTTSGLLVQSADTDRGVSDSSIALADVVFSAGDIVDDNIVIGVGTGRQVEDSGVSITNVSATIATAVLATDPFGTDNRVLVSDGTSRNAEASSVDAGDLVTAGASFGTDDSLLRADGTDKGSQSSNATIGDTGILTLRSTTDPQVMFEIIGADGNPTVQIRNFDNNATTFCLGFNNGANITSAVNATLLGVSAGRDLTTGNNVLAMGTEAALLCQSGTSTTAVGAAALRANVSGVSNVGVGGSAGLLYTANLATFVGTNAGGSLTTGNSVVCVGSNAGSNGSQLASANSIVLLGQGTYTTGSNSIAIGAGVNSSANNAVIGSTTQVLCTIRGGLRVNDQGLDADTQISGDTLSHMLFLDASAATENIALLAGSAPNWQSMDRGLFIGAATTAPTGNPTGGYFLFVDPADGNLKVRGPSGTVTTIGPP